MTRLRKLQSRKGREEYGRFLAEGPKVVLEALHAGLECHAVLVDRDAIAKETIHSILREISPESPFTLEPKDFGILCATKTPQGILAEFSQPIPPAMSLLKDLDGTLLVLHELQDPGNVGTAIRCAAGLGAEGVLTTTGCVDVWNPKTVRAAAGALFRIPVWRGIEPTTARSAFEEYGYEIWVADAKGDPVFEIQEVPRRAALVFGNESRGAGNSWGTAGFSRRIGIPLNRGVESLNVATAVAALLTAVHRREVW
jgi:TrmH family RNA methyltransferase